MFNYQRLCNEYGITLRGVIHIGAYTGEKEIQRYPVEMQKIVLIEAHPDMYLQLQEKAKDFPNIQTVNCAITNYNGEGTLYIASNDQSSSLLILKEHKKIYPEISITRQIIVQCRTLDTMMREQRLLPENFNFINIDIQGAELLAFQGASNQLKHTEIIISEVNLVELYDGCVLLEELDNFLRTYGFERKELITPCHPSWGDAFYVKI